MGLILKAAGANFEANAVSFLPPVADGLQYWGFLNDSIEKLGRNFAPGGGPLSVGGAPPVGSKGATFSTNNYVQTSVQQTPSLTLIAVGHPNTSDTAGMFINNYTSLRPGGLAGTSTGVSLYTASAIAGEFRVVANISSFTGASGAPSVTNTLNMYGFDSTKPAFVALTFDATEKVMRLHNLATGAVMTLPAITQDIDIGLGSMGVGAALITSYPSSLRTMNFAATYNRKLSEAELGLIYTRVKSYLAMRGVSV